MSTGPYRTAVLSSVHILFILVFLVYDASTCKCTGEQDRGPFCGGLLLKTGGGSDCSLDIWQCDGLGTDARWLNPCNFGCCGPPNLNSFCCIDSLCSNCTPVNRYINASQTGGPFLCASPSQSSSSSSSSSSSPSSPSCPSLSNDQNCDDSKIVIITAVFGGVATALATVVAAIILARCNKKE